MAAMRWFAAMSFMGVSIGTILVLIARHAMGSDFRAA